MTEQFKALWEVVCDHPRVDVRRAYRRNVRPFIPPTVDDIFRDPESIEFGMVNMQLVVLLVDWLKGKKYMASLSDTRKADEIIAAVRGNQAKEDF